MSTLFRKKIHFCCIFIPTTYFHDAFCAPCTRKSIHIYKIKPLFLFLIFYIILLFSDFFCQNCAFIHFMQCLFIEYYEYLCILCELMFILIFSRLCDRIYSTVIYFGIPQQKKSRPSRSTEWNLIYNDSFIHSRYKFVIWNRCNIE